MKDIKNLEVKVTFRVGLGDLQMPENCFKEFEELKKDIEDQDAKYDGLSGEKENLQRWLDKNIKLNDCYDLEYEIIIEE